MVCVYIFPARLEVRTSNLFVSQAFFSENFQPDTEEEVYFCV